MPFDVWLTTYEDHEVLRVSKGRVFLVDLRYPFDAETGKCLDPDSTMFGFRFVLGEGATE